MGQYYMPTLIAEDGSIRTLYSHAYDNGLKLMEHSYIGNNFVNAVSTLIWQNPCRVAWIGDYSNSKKGDLYESKLPHDEFMCYYTAVRGENRSALLVQPESRGILTMKSSRKYLVNHTLRTYIHMGEYIEANKWEESGLFARGRYAPFVTYDMCIHPLPLLTACGNNRGNGDYYEGRPGYDIVGSWAFDLIEITGRHPKDYEKLTICFSKKGTAARSHKKECDGLEFVCKERSGKEAGDK